MVNNFLKNNIEGVAGLNDQCVMGRLTKGVDLFEGMIQVCEKYGIQTATFQCIGSLARVGYVQLQQNDNKQLSYTDPIYVEKPVELLSGTGFIGLDLNEELYVHYHGLFVDIGGNISGGHFLHGENPTAVTIEYILQSTKEIHLQREVDPIWNLPVFQFTERG